MTALLRPPADLPLYAPAPMPAAPSNPTAPPPVLPAVARREAGAAAACIDRYGGLVFSVARRMCPATEAEDVTQEVFIELWRKADRFDPARGAEPTFVATLARRRVIDHLRRRGRRPEADWGEGDVPAGWAADGGGSDEAVAADDEAAAAREAVAGLGEKQRTVLALSVYEGLTYAEIGERLSIPLATVKSHARRGLQAVRDTLARRAQTAETNRRTFRRERGLEDESGGSGGSER